MELKLIWNIIIANVYMIYVMPNLYDMIPFYHMPLVIFLRYGMTVAWGKGVISRKMRWHPSI